MDVKLDKWFRPKIDKEVLKELTKKSDLKGLVHVSVYFSFLLITGLLAYYTLGTWWSVLWFYIYGLYLNHQLNTFPREEFLVFC